MNRLIFLAVFLLLNYVSFAQKKVLFDATKAETAGNADWIIDADNWDLIYSDGTAYIGSNGEARAQQIPTPDQSGITSSTTESYWKGALSAWGVELVQAGYYVETLPYDGQITYGNSSNPQDLSNYDMFVVCEPNFPFSDAEKTAILNFVYNGGALFMIADHSNSDRDGDGWDSPEIWNDLMQNNTVKTNPFGITFDYTDIDDDTYKIVNDGNPVISGPYGTVENVEFYGGTTMTLDPAANPSVKGVVYQSIVTSVGGTTKVMVAYARYGNGFVIAVGDSSPFDDGTGDIYDNLYDGWYQDAGGSHRIMIMNASVAALEGLFTQVNPVGEKLQVLQKGNNITVLNNENGVLLQVFDLNGKTLLTGKINGNFTFNLENPGVYLIKLTSKSSVKTAKITVF